MSDLKTNTTAKDSTDSLLWIGGLVVAAVGIGWLVIMLFWTSAPTVSVLTSPLRSVRSPQPTIAPSSEMRLSSALDDPLRMARLAFEAGMLVVPEDYSAWSLYEQLLDDEPDHAGALLGLRSVADALMQRGAAALEQGRLDDVRSAIDRVLGAFPRHEHAQRLAANLEAVNGQSASPESGASRIQRPDPITTTAPTAPRVVARSPEVGIDSLLGIQASFEAAIADNRLLTPAQNNANHFVGLMVATNRDDERTIEARRLLFEIFINRATETIASQDTQAAETWINQAETLEINAARVSEAKASLTARQIEMESLKPIPASRLERRSYSAPNYPTRAAARGIEGWVDLEFVVAVDGTTRDVEITEASHDNYFRREAVVAVEEWRFEPQVFMGQNIEQHSYTRIRFTLQ